MKTAKHRSKKDIKQGDRTPCILGNQSPQNHHGDSLKRPMEYKLRKTGNPDPL